MHRVPGSVREWGAEDIQHDFRTRKGKKAALCFQPRARKCWAFFCPVPLT